ncbi:hypothetical protein [Rhizobium sp. 1399]|uniref:HNH endonuclease n=1 Tax=Rhizobium sp. 1399 TaxID=2817758 RepID=UPI002866DB77|nr:hypothetical protein [Rhizobium sp. 1399]MDR6671394.1 excinuclease UvrABC ATPase subunit [Rhizobium sp. 1399]
MIRLNRGNPPQELDATTVSDLTAEFAASGKSVWSQPYIREALLTLSRSKCAYCETKVNEESKYMEVEHFRCKDIHPDLVVEWDNLLPACKHCNGHKSTYDVDAEGMIADPFTTDPAIHFYFQNYRLRWRDDIGRRSIDTLYLNETTRLVSVRLRIGETVAQALETIRDQLEMYISGDQTTRRRNQITRGVKRLLEEAQPSAEFSALTATVLLTDPNYLWLKQNLSDLGLWQELAPFEAIALTIALLP